MATTLSKNRRHIITLLVIFAVGVLAFVLLTILNHRITGSDDTIFQTQILPYETVAEWVNYRYQNWSGRIFSEGLVYLLSPAPFYVWQIVTVGMYGLFSALLFFYYRLFSAKRNHIKDYLMLAFALSALFLMHNAVVGDGAIWMTGSIVYFWMTAIGLLGLYPISRYVIRGHAPHWLLTVLAIPSLIIATTSQEQVGAILVGLLIVFLAYGIIRKAMGRGKFPWYTLAFSVIVTGSFAVSLHAPGNALRLELELIRWRPDFYTVPLLERVNYSYRWFLDAVVNHSGFLLVLAWVSMAGLFLAKTKKTFADYGFALLFFIVSLFSVAKGAEGLAYWFEFYASWQPTITNPLVALNITPWAVVLIATVAAPLFLFRKKPTGLLLAILFMAAFGSAAIMVFSPTLYASSWRSLFVPSVVLIFIAYILLDKILDAYWKPRYLFLALIVSLSLSQYMYQLARLVK